MRLPRANCEFVSFRIDNSTRRALLEDPNIGASSVWGLNLRGWQDQSLQSLQRFLQQTFSIIAIVRTIVNLNTFNGNAQTLQDDLEERLVTAVNNGQMTQTLQAIAAEFNITDLLNANVTGIVIDSDTPVVADDDNSSGGDDGGISKGEIAALVVCLVLAAVLLCVGMYFLNRYYLQKRNAEANNSNADFPPSPVYKNTDVGGGERLIVSSGGGSREMSREPSREVLFDSNAGDDLRPTEKAGAMIQAEPEDPDVIPL